ncbi:hypothetical protein [Paraburkholderia nemoris]|uniref:hypothetical protein n=1 Tax=Paraburkholderia nemoris TaxID=2793076 RepID=UPI0038BA64FD
MMSMLMTVMNTVSHRHTAHIMTGNRFSLMCVLRGRHFAHEMRCLAFHGDGRERLNRKAQYQQHNDEKFAPIRHDCEV